MSVSKAIMWQVAGMHRLTCAQVTCKSLDSGSLEEIQSAFAWGRGWMLHSQTWNMFMIVRTVDLLKCWKRGDNCWEKRKRTKGSCEEWRILPRLKKQIEIDPPSEDNGGGVTSARLQSRRYQHSSPHKNNWTSIHKWKQLWDGSGVQLRTCGNTVEQKRRITAQKGLWEISLDEMSGDGKEPRRLRYLYQPHCLCHRGPQWPALWRPH